MTDPQHKPIKRSPFLAPLSREHHEDLLLVWKIKAGLRKGVSIERIINYCAWFFSQHLFAHFEKEEKEFASLLSPDNPLFLQMKDDHRNIQAAVAFLSYNKKSCNLDLLEFADMLNRHVRFEERILYNYVESIATPEQLESMSCNVGICKPPEWKDQFWLN